MAKVANTRRLIQINRVFTRYGLDKMLQSFGLEQAKWIGRVQPWRRRVTHGSDGERLRLALEELGPVFIKFGQALSTRRDLLPPDLADELAKLQDAVPPFCGDQAKAIAERGLGKPVADVFAHFDTTPLASASVAQVHAAILKDGRDVVVKVLRPDIEPIIRRDVAVLYDIAALVERHVPDAHRLRPLEVVAEYEKTILDELDLLREAANGSLLRRNFLNSELLYVPEIHWDYCNDKVITMERVYGLPVSDTQAMQEAGVDFKVLSERGVEIFFSQVFRDNFFHADMHPGNIFVDVSNPALPKYIAIDFGIVSSLTDDDQNYLAYNFLAFFQRDYRKVAELHVESGWVDPDTRIDEFEAAARSVCEPIFDKPLGEISFAQVLIRLFAVGRRFQMEVQPQLVLLQKTLLNIEGLGRQLYPELNLFDTAKPFLENWARERMGVKANLDKVSKLPELPALGYRVLKQLEQADIGQRISENTQATERLALETRLNGRRRTAATAGAGLVVSAVLVQMSLGLAPYAQTFGIVLGGLGVMALTYAIVR